MIVFDGETEVELTDAVIHALEPTGYYGPDSMSNINEDRLNIQAEFISKLVDMLADKGSLFHDDIEKLLNWSYSIKKWKR